jgi:hypothetical protein
MGKIAFGIGVPGGGGLLTLALPRKAIEFKFQASRHVIRAHLSSNDSGPANWDAARQARTTPRTRASVPQKSILRMMVRSERYLPATGPDWA